MRTVTMILRAYAPVILLCGLAIGSNLLIARGRGLLGPLIAMPLVLSLASLLGVWLALGMGHYLLRCVVAFVGIAMLGLGLCVAIGEMEAEWFVLVALVTGFVASAAAALRLWGLRLVHHAKMAAPSSRFQFTIWQLLSATLVVACQLGKGRMLSAWFDSAEGVVIGFALAICFAGIAATALWGVLNPALPGTLTASVVAVATAGIVYYAVEVTAIDPGGLWFAITLAHSSLLILLLVAVRFCGYRLARPQGEPPTTR